MPDIEKEIEEIEADIETAKIEKAQAQGAIKANLKQLKDDFELNSVKEAEAYIKAAEAELIERESELKEKFNKLKDKIDGKL